MPNDFSRRFTQALNEALAQAIPDTPSGSHRILVVGQLVVNIQQTTCPTLPNSNTSTR